MIRCAASPARLRLAIPIAAAVFALASGAAAAAPATIGSVSFEAPDPAAGWTAKPSSGGMIYQKLFTESESSKKGAALIQITTPAPGSDGFDAAFERVANGIREFAGERPIVKSSGTTANGYRIRVDERCCARLKGVSANQSAVGIASKDRQVFVALVKLGLDRDTRKSLDETFTAIVRSVKLDPSDKAFALVPAKDDGGLKGVFTHLSTGIRPNAFGGTDFYSDSLIKVFDPSGLYSTEIPKDGDMEGHCRRAPKECGLYGLKGGGFFSSANTIELREVADDYGTIKVETRDFGRKGEDLLIGKDSYRHVPPFTSATPFSGTWRYVFASSGSMAFSSGSVAVERTLVMGRDGRFTRIGWSGASSTNSAGDATTGFTAGGKRPGSAGRYRVKDYTLELTSDEGGTESLSLFAPDIGSDKLLVINGANYLKKE